ncbi:MAG: hypothetical protein HOL60_07890 [Pelagibacteraceae bacterium]|nr:hypothetical protein [Pelagibacteraceae bacterium]MBT5214468.1 hypothetical protein [Pelagibacteraceae bacterium]MBT6353479.1 hypothetical protein [Pelagibacteraceae bacterium]
MNKIFSFLLFAFIISCQPIEQIEEVVFDNSQLSKINILSKDIEVKTTFEKKITDPYIGHTLRIEPSQRIANWINDNFKAIGNENKLEVVILDSSLLKTEFENKDTKNFDEKKNYKYELFYLIEFNLYDDSNNLVASTLVETIRSTTSGVYISIQNTEKVIDDLVYLSLLDLSLESNKLLKQYMSDFLL